jgi:hypothetical protein
MLLDYEIAPCTRRCAATGRALARGESYYSTLHIERGTTVRRDFAADAWSAPPAEAIAWWHTRAPGGAGAKGRLAPNEALLDLFAALAEEPAETEFRYVLGLLLLRRRLVKLERTTQGARGDVLILDCPTRQEQFELVAAAPSNERMADLERRLGDLLYGGAQGPSAQGANA